MYMHAYKILFYVIWLTLSLIQNKIAKLSKMVSTCIFITVSLKEQKMCSQTSSIKSNILTVIHAVQFWYELLLAECSGEGFSACRSSLELT